MPGDFTTREEIREVYERHAGIYELAVHACNLLGFPIGRYRRLVVEAADLQPGDTVVEIGCGTGMNFPLLERRIGPQGRIIGVDQSPAMLERAEERIRRAGWKNVELVNSAADDYSFPDGVDGIIATGVLTYVPDYDGVIGRGAKALAPAGKWVVFDYKMPVGWMRHLVPVFIWIYRPFGISRALFERTPIESLRRHMADVTVREFYFGLLFIAAGRSSPA